MNRDTNVIIQIYIPVKVNFLKGIFVRIYIAWRKCRKSHCPKNGSTVKRVELKMLQMYVTYKGGGDQISSSYVYSMHCDDQNIWGFSCDGFFGNVKKQRE